MPRSIGPRRCRLSAQGITLVQNSKQLQRTHGIPPQDWRGTITSIGFTSYFNIHWDHKIAKTMWNRKYIEVEDDRAEASSTRVRFGPTQTTPTPSQAVRDE